MVPIPAKNAIKADFNPNNPWTKPPPKQAIFERPKRPTWSDAPALELPKIPKVPLPKNWLTHIIIVIPYGL